MENQFMVLSFLCLINLNQCYVIHCAWIIAFQKQSLPFVLQCEQHFCSFMHLLKQIIIYLKNLPNVMNTVFKSVSLLPEPLQRGDGGDKR